MLIADLIALALSLTTLVSIMVFANASAAVLSGRRHDLPRLPGMAQAGSSDLTAAGIE